MMRNNQAPDARGSLLKRIHAAYEKLPTGERQVADTLLDSPQEVAVWTASELAVRAGVSNATVSRLVKRLGYRNFEAARQDARKLRETGAPLYMADSNGAGDFAGLINAEAALIEATLSAVDLRSLRAAAAAIAKAPRVRVLGYRNSSFLAGYLAAQLAQFRAGASPLMQDGQTMAEGIAALHEQDLVIVFGLRRRPAGFERIIRKIASRGCRLVLVCDRSLRGVQSLASWSFDCAVATDWQFDSYAGAMALTRLILHESGLATGERGKAYLAEVEAIREDLAELEDPTG